MRLNDVSMTETRTSASPVALSSKRREINGALERDDWYSIREWVPRQRALRWERAKHTRTRLIISTTLLPSSDHDKYFVRPRHQPSVKSMNTRTVSGRLDSACQFHRRSTLAHTRQRRPPAQDLSHFSSLERADFIYLTAGSPSTSQQPVHQVN